MGEREPSRVVSRVNMSKVSIKGFKYCKCCGEYVLSKNYDPVERMCYECSDNESDEYLPHMSGNKHWNFKKEKLVRITSEKALD